MASIPPLFSVAYELFTVIWLSKPYSYRGSKRVETSVTTSLCFALVSFGISVH